MKRNFNIIFLITSIILGIIFSILIPLYQVPDEPVHINMIYEELGYNMDFVADTNECGDTLRIVRNPDEIVNIKEYFGCSVKTDFISEVKIPSYRVVKHLPQSIGIIIGEIFDLPMLITLSIAEVMAVIFYSFICYKALQIMPIKKYLFASIMLLPMCIQQMSSLSYDAVLLPICFYLISYILYLKFSKDKVNNKDILMLLMLLLIIAIIKIPYVLLGLLVFILPIKKIDITLFKKSINYEYLKKNKKVLITIFIILLVVISGLMIFMLSKVDYGRVLIACILKPFTSIKILFNTIIKYWLILMKGISGEFGWLDTHVSKYYTFIVLIFIILISLFDKSKEKLSKKDNIILVITFILISILIFTSMIGWTFMLNNIDASNLTILELSNLIKSNITIIEGVQGRYFLEILPLIFIPLCIKKDTKFDVSIIFYIYLIFVVIHMFIKILFRYWI